MRNAGLIAFSVTTCVLVPAAIHRLSAGKEQIAKLQAPDENTIELKGAKIKASLDRFMLDPGEKLTVKLEASEAKGKNLEVGVLVLGSNGSEGDRVPTPPNGVAFRVMKLDTKDGTGTAQMEVALKGAGTREYRPFGHYTVLVGEPEAIRKLESLRRRWDYVGDPSEGIPSLNKSGEKFMSLFQGYGIEDDDTKSPYGEGKLARLEAHTRPKSDAITVAMPDTTNANTAFMVSVTLTNPGKRKMTGLDVNLTEQSTFTSDWSEPPPTRVAILPEKVTIDLGPHETRTVQFAVTPTEAGIIGLYANATCVPNYENEKACRDVQAFQLGAFDATESRVIDAKPPAVVVR